MSGVEDAFGIEPEQIEQVEQQQEQQVETPVEPVVEPAPVPEPKETAKPEIPDGYVPQGVVKELRQELRELKARANQPATEAAPEPVDMFADPEGFNQQINQRILNTKLDLSEAMNAERHGGEVVERAKEWALEQFSQNAAFRAEVLSKPDPYGFVIREMRRHEALAKLGDADPSEIEQFHAWKAAQAQTQQAAPAAEVQQATPPPRSMASAPNAGDSAAKPKPDPNAEKVASLFG